MAGEEFSSRLPRLAGNIADVLPPLVFTGVSARCFPLRASLGTLQRLCDCYLNTVPQEAGYFRVSSPYAYMVILNYGQMGEAVMRAGWFSQLEVFFGVFVEWYKRVAGRWVFHDWGMITPYIFVDDEVSVPVGRLVYGFPKILSKVELAASGWIKDPVAGTTVASVATNVFPKVYADGSLEMRTFLEVRQGRISTWRAPFDAAAPFLPWTVASNVAGAIGGMGRDAMWLAQSMRIFPFNPLSDPSLFGQVMNRVPAWWAPGGTGFVMNSLNMKQHRHSEKPSEISYQALTNCPLQIKGFNRAGLLGEEYVMAGDPSGGYSIRLDENASLPIVSTLGLEVRERTDFRDRRSSQLRPVMPFWVDVDLICHAGTNVAWRTHDGLWKDETGARFPPNQPPRVSTKPDFNSTIPNAVEAVAGPFRFDGTTIGVMPLRAEKKKLEVFLDKNLNQAFRCDIDRADGKGKVKVRFEVWSRPAQRIDDGKPVGGETATIYMAVSMFSGVKSGTDDVGDWAKSELAFLIPVRWQRWVAPPDDAKAEDNGVSHGWVTQGVGVFPAFAFVDNGITAFSRLEIQGIDAITADFVTPERAWLSDEGIDNPAQPLMRVGTELLPALGFGQKAGVLPVIEIRGGQPDASPGQAPDAAWKRAQELQLDLETKKAARLDHWVELKCARALALEVLGNKQALSIYTLKEIPDANDPSGACYQSLVRVCRELTEVFDVREIEQTLCVRIHEYPSLSIASELGIVSEFVYDESGGIVKVAQGVRPFYIRATVSEPLARRVMWRAGTTKWTILDSAFQTMLSEQPGSPQITADLGAETIQDWMDPSRTAEAMFQARRRRESGSPVGEIDVRRARQAVKVADPQIVIDAILSREWSNNDPNSRWRKGWRTLADAFDVVPSGDPTKAYTQAEMYRRMNNKLSAAPGAIAAIIPKDELDKIIQALWNRPNSGEKLPEKEEFLKRATRPIPKFASREQASKELSGEAFAGRWQQAIKEVIASQTEFTERRLEMEHNVTLLTSVAILGLSGVADAYSQTRQARQASKRHSDQGSLEEPSSEKYYETLVNLYDSIRAIAGMAVEGEPYHPDANVTASFQRLGELLKALQTQIEEESNTNDINEVKIERARSHQEEFQKLVQFARQCCDFQRQALLNKMARACQKPDYCIQRDLVGVDADRILPTQLSWDSNWYYGEPISFAPRPNPTAAQAGAIDGT